MSAEKSTKLTKAETTALWHVVINSAYMLRALKEDGATPEQIAHETQILVNAKRALRKVNALRKQGL